MKCPRCGLVDRPPAPRCPGCGFTLETLDRALGEPPPRTTPLHDGAGLLSDAERAALSARIHAASQRAHGEIAVVTVASTAPVRPAEFAFWLFNRWELAAPHRRGVLMLLAVHEQRIEIEAGYGWEALLGDLATGEALDRRAVPLLRQRDWLAGLAAAVDDIAALVTAAAPRGEGAP